MSYLAKQTLNGTIWTYLSRYSGKFINFITITILARILLQDDFGVAGYALVVIGFFEITGMGVGPALIYFDKHPNRTNTAFWLALLLGLLFFGLIMLSAPLVGMFFQDDRAVPVTRALALTLPLLALSAIPQAFLRKDLAFNKNFVPNFVGASVKGITGISLALIGFGAWSIIIGQLVGTAVKTISYWFYLPEKWIPSFHFDRSYVKPLLAFAGSIIAIDLLAVLLLNVDYLIVGRFLGATALAIYTIAFRLPELLIMSLASIVGNVLFPVYAKMKDPAAIGKGFLVSTRYVMMITLPMAVGLALVARPLVLLIFSDKWVDAIPVVAAIALYSAIRAIYTDGGAFKALGKPSLTTKLHMITVIVVVPVLWWVTVQYRSLEVVAWTQVILVSFICVFRLTVTSHVLQVKLLDIFHALQPALLGCAIMAVPVWLVLQLIPDDMLILELVSAVSVGILTYGGVMWWLEHDVVVEVGATLRSALNRRA